MTAKPKPKPKPDFDIIDIPCYLCEKKGRCVIAGAILSNDRIPQEALSDFLQANHAIIICSKCSEEFEHRVGNIESEEAEGI